MKQRFLSVLVVALMLVGIIVPSTARAQQGNGFVISPILTELTVERGKTETVKLTVENPTADKVSAQILVNDFEPSAEENGKPQIILDSSKRADGNSFKDLVGDLGSIDLAAKEKKSFEVKIAIPKKASAGGYYGAIRVAAKTGQTEKNASLAASVASLFLIRVPGDLTENLRLVELTAAKDGNSSRFFVSPKNMSVITRLENTGNIHVKPFGKIQVKDSKGNVVEEYEFNNTKNQRVNVLPTSTRKFEDKLQDRDWFGKYTITANLGYGTGGSLITASNTFWAFPLWFAIVIAVLLVVVMVAVFLLWRKLAAGKARSRRRR